MSIQTKNFRVQYRNVRIWNRPELEYIQATSPENAFRQFVKRRQGENWKTEEILARSLCLIIDESGGETFTPGDFVAVPEWA